MWKSRYSAFRLAALYSSFAIIWIIGTDALVNLLPPTLSAVLQSAKGTLFVLVSAGLFYLVVERATDYARREIASSTMVEKLLGQVLDASPVGIMLASDDGTVTFINPAAQEMCGLTDAEALGRLMEDVCSPDPTAVTGALGVALRTGEPQELQIGGRQGDARSVSAQAALVDTSLPGSGWVVSLYDVSAVYQKVAESNDALGRYRFLAEAVQECAHATDERQLLESVARLAVDSGRYKAAWAIALDERGRYEQVAAPGLGARANEVAAAVLRTVMKTTREPNFEAEDALLTSNNLSADLANIWSAAAAVESLGSSAELSVSTVNRLVGRLMLFAEHPGAFGADERLMLETLLGEMSLAAGKIQLERSRLTAEEEAQDSQYGYRRLFEQHPAPMWVYDLETLKFLEVNDAAVAKYGYSREEFLAMSIGDIRPKEDMPRLLANVNAVSSGFDDAGIWTHVDRGGREFPVHIYSHTTDWNGRRAEVVMILEVARIE